MLEVWAYPSNSSTLKLDSKAIKKPPWEAKIDGLKDKFQELFNHATALIPQLPKATIELLEGKVELTNGWEEVPESNLARWKAGVKADIELVSVALEFQVSIFKFLKAAESVAKAVAEVNKIREFFEKKFGLYIEAGLFLTVKISLALKGDGGWEKEVGGKAVPHLESLKMEEGASITLEARLDVGYKKDGAKGELVSMSGKATTELTLSSSPRLESGGGANPHFWLDSEFEWKPLTLTLEAKVHAPHKNSPNPPKAAPTGHGDKPAIQGKSLTKADVHNTEAAQPALLSLHWTGEVLPKVKKDLPSLDLLTGETGARPAGEPGKPLTVVPREAPPVKPTAPAKPAAKPPAKP